MQDQLNTMEANKTWSIVYLPSDKHIIGCKWVNKGETKPNNSQQDRHKVRHVAKGLAQQVGMNFTNTFSPFAILTIVSAYFYRCC